MTGQASWTSVTRSQHQTAWLQRHALKVVRHRRRSIFHELPQRLVVCPILALQVRRAVLRKPLQTLLSVEEQALGVDDLTIAEPRVEDTCERHAMSRTSGVRLEPDADTDEVVRQIGNLILGVQEAALVNGQLASLRGILHGPCRVISCILLQTRNVRKHHGTDSLVDLFEGARRQRSPKLRIVGPYGVTKRFALLVHGLNDNGWEPVNGYADCLRSASCARHHHSCCCLLYTSPSPR